MLLDTPGLNKTPAFKHIHNDAVIIYPYFIPNTTLDLSLESQEWMELTRKKFSE